MDKSELFDKHFNKRCVELLFTAHPEGSKGKEVLIWQYLQINDVQFEHYFLSELYFQKRDDGTYALIHKYVDPYDKYRDKSGTVVSGVIQTGLDIDDALQRILQHEDSRIREMTFSFVLLALRKFSKTLVKKFIQDIKTTKRKVATSRELKSRRRWWCCVQATKNASWFTENIWFTGCYRSQSFELKARSSRGFERLRGDQHRRIWKYAGEYYDANQSAPLGWHSVDGVEGSVKFAPSDITLPTEKRR